ncbi:copper amine oxidase N-terminal domain-containing protein [Calidifontibacillus erzurumensis]|uniref:copper amine oxidase N-terminal domain-containing protein n=1 Tax=Calidifontibacillus erzurumensis TaxID=2741433 RepID=UPI0035B53391
MKKALMKAVSFLILLQLFIGLQLTRAESTVIYWSDVEKGSYSNLYPYTFLWSSHPYDDPKINGVNLKAFEITDDPDNIDFVINQYGEMAANGIVQVNEKLEEATDLSQYYSFQNSITIKSGGVYLIVTSDDDFAKIRIDSILPTKVNFSYVLASEIVDDSSDIDYGNGNPSDDYIYDEPGDVYYELEEGNVMVSVESDPNDAYYILYRSDNGGPFIKLTDFPIYEPYFVDKYALAGHKYVYYFDIYDEYDRKIASSVNVHVTVIKPKSTNTTPTKPTTGTGEIIIQLQVNNKNSTVNGTKKTLDVPPIVVDGRTLVPLRFISESLGADVKWNGSDSSITITYNGKTIKLWLNKSEAIINGKKVFLDVPAQSISGRTMVPIRFISENLDQEISFDNKTLGIIIKTKSLSNSSSNNSTTVQVPGTNQNFSSFAGTWDLWVPGGYSKIDTVTPYTQGEGGDYLIISDYGIYSWISVDGKVIDGKWSKSGNEIVLHNAKYGWDWNVKEYDWSDGKGIMVYVLGTYYEGRKVE